MNKIVSPSILHPPSFNDVYKAANELRNKRRDFYRLSLELNAVTVSYGHEFTAGRRLHFRTVKDTEGMTYDEYTYDDATSIQNELFISRINDLIDGEVASAKIDWDRRMLKLAAGEINTWSKDPSTKVSATIFRGKHPVAMSYNGFPPGIEDTEERLNNRELKYKLVQHAEANAIATCAKLGISTEGTTMAVTHHPCPTCAGQMIAAGIKKVICQPPSEDFLSRWSDQVMLAKDLFKEAGVELVVIDLSEKG